MMKKLFIAVIKLFTAVKSLFTAVKSLFTAVNRLFTALKMAIMIPVRPPYCRGLTNEINSFNGIVTSYLCPITPSRCYIRKHQGALGRWITKRLSVPFRNCSPYFFWHLIVCCLSHFVMWFRVQSFTGWVIPFSICQRITIEPTLLFILKEWYKSVFLDHMGM